MQVGFAGVRWTEDAGRPPETDFREQKVSNRPVLHSIGVAVSDREKVVHRRWQVHTGKMTVSDLIAQNLLRAVFQPIFRFADGEVFGYEALIRGPRGSPLEYPPALLEAAGREDLSIEFERRATKLIAEGVESEEDMKVVRDLGIAFGQGFFFARPAAVPTQH